MAKFYVEIAQLVRQTKVILVEAPSREVLEKPENMADVYYNYDDDGNDWLIDSEFCEEGTHHVISELDNADEMLKVGRKIDVKIEG